MSKLLLFKEWLTLKDAAAHMSIVLDEPATVADLLRLGLDGHLKLSAHLINVTYMKRGRVVSNEDAGTHQVPYMTTLEEDLTKPDGMGHRKRRFDAPNRGWSTMDLPAGDRVNDDERVLFNEYVERVTGLFDIPMIGGEEYDVARMLQDEIGGPPVKMLNIDGGLLATVNEPRELWRVMEPYNRRRTNPAWLANPEDKSIPRTTDEIIFDHIPSGGLPETCLVVVRTAELRRFIASASGQSPAVEGGRVWPAFETPYLAALRAATKEWWSDFDPTHPNDAPSNSDVTEWLIREHQVPSSLAKEMARILRAPEAKRGPKPEDDR